MKRTKKTIVTDWARRGEEAGQVASVAQGYRLNIILAEKVMGWTFKAYGNGGGEFQQDGKTVAHLYSWTPISTWAQAQQVAETWRLKEGTNRWWDLTSPRAPGSYWGVRFVDGVKRHKIVHDVTAEKAICEALAMVLGEQP